VSFFPFFHTTTALPIIHEQWGWQTPYSLPFHENPYLGYAGLLGFANGKEHTGYILGRSGLVGVEG